MEPYMKYFISPESEIPMTTSDTSWLVSAIEFGEMPISIPAGILADRFGRRTLLLSSGPLYLLSWVLILTTRSKALLFVIRTIQGLGLGIAFTVVPMYVAEIAEPRIRGELSGLSQTMWFLGILFSYLIGNYLSYQNDAYVGLATPIIFFVLFYMMPESPYYQLMSNQPKEAIKSLRWLRATDQIDEEFQKIKETVEKEMQCKGGWRDLFATKAEIKSFFIVQTVCFVKCLNGMPAIVAYATQTFAQSSNGFIKDYELTIAVGILLSVSTFGAAFVSDSVGRRTLLIFSALASAFFNIVTGTYYFLIQQGYDLSHYYWIMFVSVAGFCIAANVGLGPLALTIQAEYFPSHTRAIGGGITGISTTLSTFINLKQYQTVEDIAGVYLNFWIFALFSFLGAILMHIFVTETAGKSLGQIQDDFEKAGQVENKEEIEATRISTRV